MKPTIASVDVHVIKRPGRDLLGEGPLWVARENALYWVDILGQRINRLSIDSGRIDGWDSPEMIGWVIERADGRGFVAGLRSGFVELDLDPFAIRPIADPEPLRPYNRLNDAKADSAGNIWAGTMSVRADSATGGLYRLGADRTITSIDQGYTIANGPAFSPDERWLYHTDTKLGLVYRYTLGPDGIAGSRDVFITFEPDWGGPDGMAVDADGCLWIAHWGPGLVSRFDPDGARMHSVALPTPQITSCTFAGPNLDRLFITSAAFERPDDPLAGALFEIDPRCRGLAPKVSAIRDDR